MQLSFCITTILLIVASSFCGAATHGQPTADNTTIIESLGLSHVLTAQRLEEIIDAADIQSQILLEPIYIGGARYQLNASDFKFAQILDPNTSWPPTLYRASIPVYGDSGQDLYFDIFGNAEDTVEGLKSTGPHIMVSCGTYSDSDSGPEYVMSKVMSTGGSCQILHLSYIVEGRQFGGPFFNLNVLISEEISF